MSNWATKCYAVRDAVRSHFLSPQAYVAHMRSPKMFLYGCSSLAEGRVT